MYLCNEQTSVWFRRMRNPKRDLYERYMGALFLLKLRPIFVIQKTNSSSVSIQNKHRLIFPKMVSKFPMFDYIVRGQFSS